MKNRTGCEGHGRQIVIRQLIQRLTYDQLCSVWLWLNAQVRFALQKKVAGIRVKARGPQGRALGATKAGQVCLLFKVLN